MFPEKNYYSNLWNIYSFLNEYLLSFNYVYIVLCFFLPEADFCYYFKRKKRKPLLHLLMQMCHNKRL